MPKRVANSGSFAKGHDPRRNTTKPGPGRTPESWKRFCRKVFGDKAVTVRLRSIAKNPQHPAYQAMTKMLAAYAYGQPQASVEVTGKLSLEQILARSWDKPKGKGKKHKKGTSR